MSNKDEEEEEGGRKKNKIMMEVVDTDSIVIWLLNQQLNTMPPLLPKSEIVLELGWLAGPVNFES